MRVLFIFSLVCLYLTVAKSQTDSLNQLDQNGKRDGRWTVYYNSKGKEVSDSTQATYYRYTWYEHGKNLHDFDWFSKGDQIITPSTTGQNTNLQLLHGAYKIVAKNGQLKSIHVFDQGNYVTYRNFYASGALHEYCNFTNLHFERGVFEAHTYCKRVYSETGEVTYYYMRDQPAHEDPADKFHAVFERSAFDSTAVKNQKVVGDSIFATVTQYSGNVVIRQMDQIFIAGQRSIAHGSYTSWYTNGQKKQEGLYDHNKKAGEWKYWLKDGTEIKVHIDPAQLNRTDEAGAKTGWWIMYLDENLKRLKDSVGATHCMYNYYTGKFFHYAYGNQFGPKKIPIHLPESDTLKLGNFHLLNGDYTKYYKSGNVQCVLSASNGILTEYKVYYPDGKLHLHFIYSTECGAPIRTCLKEYDKNGNLKYDGPNWVPREYQEI